MFTSDADVHRADWPLLQNGAVNLFHRREVLEKAQRDLASLSYEVVEISCGAGFEARISEALRWREQFGYAPWSGNLDAFSDGMAGYPFGPSGRSALLLDGFHHLAAVDAERARAVLDIIEGAARDHLLWGKVLACLVQTDDPRYECQGLGARGGHWNARESLNADRGL